MPHICMITAESILSFNLDLYLPDTLYYILSWGPCQSVVNIYNIYILYTHTHTSMWASQVVQCVKNLPEMQEMQAGMGSIPRSGRSPGGRHGNPHQYSCLENHMDRGAWKATVHRVTKSWTQLKWLNMNTHTHVCVYRYIFHSHIISLFNRLRTILHANRYTSKVLSLWTVLKCFIVWMY